MEKSDIQKEIELTLSSLDGLKKATAPDGITESVMKSIIFQKDQIMWIRRVRYAMAAMIAFAIINVVLLITINSSSRNEMIQSVASEWNLTTEAY